MNVSAKEMTLRDYFATQAMQGIISANWSVSRHDGDLAKKAYEIADKMLKAREAE